MGRGRSSSAGTHWQIYSKGKSMSAPTTASCSVLGFYYYYYLWQNHSCTEHEKCKGVPKCVPNIPKMNFLEYLLWLILHFPPYSLTVFTSAPLGRQLTFTLNKMSCCCPSCTQRDAQCVRLPIKQVHMTLESRQAGWWDVAGLPLPSCGRLRNKHQSLIYFNNNKTYLILGGKIVFFPHISWSRLLWH